MHIRMGERLRELRKQNHLTQQQVAERVGVTASVMSSYEAEDRHPSYDVLLKLATLYNTSTDYLIGRDNGRTIDVSQLTEREISLITEYINIIKEKNSSQ